MFSYIYLYVYCLAGALSIEGVRGSVTVTVTESDFSGSEADAVGGMLLY